MEMHRMLVNHEFRLDVTTNSNFRKLLLLLFQYFPNRASQVKCLKILPTLWRDKRVHYRKKKNQVFWSTTMLKTIAIHTLFVYGPLRRRKGLLSQKDISFRIYLNRERKSSWEAFREGTQASYFTQFSTHPHRRWLKVSVFQRY